MKQTKIAAVALAVMFLPALAGCKGGEVSVPDFTSEGGVRFTAYAAPTVRKKVDGLTEEHYQKLSEAGFNKAVALYEGSSAARGNDTYETIVKRSEKAQADALAALNLAEKYGIKYYVRDWSFYGLGKNFKDITTKEQFETVISKMFDENNAYIKHSAYGGNFGFDEPDIKEMETIVWQAELYNEYVAKNGNGGELFVNLLPAYVGDNTVSLDPEKQTTYTEYVDYYFENIAPLLGYVSYDYYPFKVTGNGKKYVRNTYYYNYEMMAERCKKGDYELRAFVQAKGDFTGTRSLCGVGDLRFQIYSGMAFGCREFTYYTYSSEVNETNYTTEDGYSLYDLNTGKYTWLYDAAKTVNNEVHAMEKAYAAYDWEGVMYKNADEMYENQLFANLDSPLESHEKIAIQACTQDTLVGTFTANDESNANKHAFMLVNAADPSADKDDEVTLKFNGAKSLLMYRLGQKIVVPLSKEGTYTFKLYPGEGRFVIPLS